MARRRKNTFTTTLNAEGSTPIAAEAVPGHASFIADGYQLGPTRMWLRADGSWTGKFIYRDPARSDSKIECLVRGMVFKREVDFAP